MIVIDASAVVELLTAGSLADAISHAIGNPDQELAAPYIIDIEVMSALRGLAAGKRLIDRHSAAELIATFTSLPIDRYSHIPLLERIWELRHNFTAYDAAYIALAEQTDSILYTCDARLANGHRARTKLFIRN